MLNGITFSDRSFPRGRVLHSAYQELVGLWEAVFGEKPSVVAEPTVTARVLVSCLPAAEPYSFGAVSDPEEDPKPPEP